MEYNHIVLLSVFAGSIIGAIAGVAVGARFMYRAFQDNILKSVDTRIKLQLEKDRKMDTLLGIKRK